jgi:hypothetical protein
VTEEFQSRISAPPVDRITIPWSGLSACGTRVDVV